MPNTRRAFLRQTGLASIAVITTKSLFAREADKPDSLIRGVQIGAITYSFRSLPGNPDQTLQYCVDSGISAIELMGDAVEDWAGKPANPVKFPPRVPGQPRPELTDEQKAQLKAYQQQVVSWRENVSMDAFKTLRKKYNEAGVTIYAFKPNALNPDNTDGEITYAMNAARALGARSVTVELPTDPAHSKRLGELGEKNKMFIGYHAHLQATDTAWDTALAQSPYNSINLDCGHYIAAGENNTPASLLALIEAKHDRITSMHIKDRKNKINGGRNMPWGEGDTPLKAILVWLRDKKYRIPATIELEYDIPAGSDAVKETRKCLEYARAALEAAPSKTWSGANPF
ncbi:MAG: sugar phosphate isomerase/epimerase [Chitinophagaceae bacterium]|nr:sugar phosphate isomerase/epimerase [Chitinophagaceae bacterium]